MMAVGVQQDLSRHSQQPGSLPGRHATLHQPGRGCVPKRVGRYSAAELGQRDAAAKPLLDGSDRFAIELDKRGRDQLFSYPPAHVSQ